MFVGFINTCFFFLTYLRIVIEIKFTGLIPYELISFVPFHSSFHLLSASSEPVIMTCPLYIYLKKYQIWSPIYIASFCERHHPPSGWQARNILVASALTTIISNSHQVLWILPSKYLLGQSTSLWLHCHSPISNWNELQPNYWKSLLPSFLAFSLVLFLSTLHPSVWPSLCLFLK